MLKRARAAHARQARHNNAAFSSHTDLTRYPSRVGTRKAVSELHILLLARPEGTESDGAEAVQGLLRAFTATGAQVFLHEVAQPQAKLSLASFTKGKVQMLGSTRGKLEGALEEGTPLAAQLGLDAGELWVGKGEDHKAPDLREVGLVFPHDTDADITESSTGFMQVVASRLGGKTPVTVYLAPRPTSADFDTDEEQPRSVRIAHAAADTLTKSLALIAPSAESTDDDDVAVVGTSKRMSLDWTGLNTANASAANRKSAASGSSGHARRHSFIPHTNGSYLDPSPAVKPLLLRPAPGPGPQSVSLRLALPGMNQDVVLRVAEAVSPVDEVRKVRHRPTSSISGRPQDLQSETGVDETEGNKRDSFLLPILSRGMGASRSPSPSALSFASSSSRRSSRVSFTSSISEEGEDGPLTPPSPAKQRLSSPPALHLNTAAHGGSLFSPIDLPSCSPDDDSTPVCNADRYATLRKRRSEVVYGGGQENGGVFVEGDVSPVWGNVAELLKGRQHGARARGVGGLPIRLSQ